MSDKQPPTDDQEAKPEDQSAINKTDTTEQLPVVQQTIATIGHTPHQYDVKGTIDFIDSVFASDVPAGAHRLVYTSSTNLPGYPLASVSQLDGILKRLKVGRALYFNTSSCVPDDTGKLRHMKDLFSAFHVLVLDDIGTKIPLDRLPQDMLDPSYIIESSAGNFQYGYVLDEPVTDYDHARAIVSTAALAGLTDSGGAMPCKVVRLPDGINGKSDPLKREFHVKLIHNTGPSYTPDELVKRMNLEIDGELVTWDAIQNDEIEPLAKKYRTKYMPIASRAMSSEGIVDEVLEWLYAHDMVVSDSDDWVEIECPWHHKHTSGTNTAGYSPLGRGAEPHRRGFNCFHDNCSDRHGLDFIQHVMANSDIDSLPLEHRAPLLAGDFAFDIRNDKVWGVGNGIAVYNLNGFKNGNNHTVWTYRRGATKAVRSTVADVWMHSPYRIVVQGAVHMPNEGAVYTDPQNAKWVNTYQGPEWGDGAYDQAHVDKFVDYIEYLVPEPAEQAYFLDWLAAKAQDPTFRGTGIVMVAPTQGVGRSTLATMLSTMFGNQNCTNVSFDDLVNPQAYNHWEDKLFVTVSEAKEASGQSSTLGGVKAYEALKQRVDTTNNIVTMNVKYQPQRSVLACSSYLILTNHGNAIRITSGDRRLTMMANNLVPRDNLFFTNFHVWLNQKDASGRIEWAKHVYRWLRGRPVNLPTLQLPLNTATKAEMIANTTPFPQQVMIELEKYMAANTFSFITSTQMMAVMEGVINRSTQVQPEYSDKYLQACCRDVSETFKRYEMRVNSKKSRVRVMRQAIGQGFNQLDLNRPATQLTRQTQIDSKHDINKIDVNAIIDHIVDNMVE
jgi:hypothetical protein